MLLMRPILPLLILLSISLPAFAEPATLVIFAASSLRQPFEELADLYQQRYAGERPLLNFAGSQVLRTQLQQGAEADLLVSANLEITRQLEEQGLIEPPRLFAGNRLALLVDRHCERLQHLSDLVAPGLLLATGNQHVPVGRYTRQLWENLAADPKYGRLLVEKIRLNIVSKESSVKAIVTKLQLGEVDAALVYRSEMSEALLARTRSISLPEQHNPMANYPVALIRHSTARDSAMRFIDLLLSADGQQLLRKHHFQPAPDHAYAKQ